MPSTNVVELSGRNLTVHRLATLVDAADTQVTLAPASLAAIAESHAFVHRVRSFRSTAVSVNGDLVQLGEGEVDCLAARRELGASSRRLYETVRAEVPPVTEGPALSRRSKRSDGGCTGVERTCPPTPSVSFERRADEGAMRVFGGFAQHGYRRGIWIDGRTLVRRCDDCGLEWSPGGDVEARANSQCVSARDPASPGKAAPGTASKVDEKLTRRR